jgi:hypothetical protein
MNKAHAAAATGAAWLRSRLNPDGSLRGANTLAAYYKVPCALQWNGHAAEATQVLRYVQRRFLTASGDLDGTGVAWIEQYRIYPHAWLCCAAAEAGETQLVSQLVRFLLSWRDESSGGFRARLDGSEEIMTTSMAALACLRAGLVDVAGGAVGWLRRIMDAQPDIRRGLYHVWHPDAGLVRGDGSVAYLVDVTQPRQWYFLYGISAAFLTEYSRTTGDAAALDLARAYLHASEYCFADRYATPQSGKLGWGAAWMYLRTKDRKEDAIVKAVVEGLLALQCGDGTWNAQGVYEANPGAEDDSRFDVTAEFVALLAQMGAIERV